MSSRAAAMSSKERQELIHKESMDLTKTSGGIIPYMEGEIVNLEEEIAAFRKGERENAQFMPFRLRQGVYGQRQPDAQMLRVKIPGGIVTAEALDMLGEVADTYVPLKKGHVTTRENIQFHHVRLEDAPKALRLLGQVGLTTREACGNTVRNVVGSPTAGVCHDEAFDITPYLAAYVRFAVRHPLTQDFPRKFKTSFTGCSEHDTVASAIHDLSYIAKVKHDNGLQKRGFKVMVGGGTSIMARLGKVLYEFIPEEDYLRVAEALWRVFDKSEMLRKNRMMARIKVLIDRIGIDAFKELVEEELEQIGPIDPAPLMSLDGGLQRATAHASGSRVQRPYAACGVHRVEEQQYHRTETTGLLCRLCQAHSRRHIRVPVSESWPTWPASTPAEAPVRPRIRTWPSAGCLKVISTTYGRG